LRLSRPLRPPLHGALLIRIVLGAALLPGRLVLSVAASVKAAASLARSFFGLIQTVQKVQKVLRHGFVLHRLVERLQLRFDREVASSRRGRSPLARRLSLRTSSSSRSVRAAVPRHFRSTVPDAALFVPVGISFSQSHPRSQQPVAQFICRDCFSRLSINRNTCSKHLRYPACAVGKICTIV
jgi:hypothetical protein